MLSVYLYGSGSRDTLRAYPVRCDHFWQEGEHSLDFDPSKRTVICLPGMHAQRNHPDVVRDNLRALEKFLGPLDHKDAPQVFSLAWPDYFLVATGIARHHYKPYDSISPYARRVTRDIFLPLIATQKAPTYADLRADKEPAYVLLPIDKIKENLSRITLFANSFGTSAAQEFAGALADLFMELGLKKQAANELVSHVFMLGVNNTAAIEVPPEIPQFSGVRITGSDDEVAAKTMRDFQQRRNPDPEGKGFKLEYMPNSNVISLSLHIPEEVNIWQMGPDGPHKETESDIVEFGYGSKLFIGHSTKAYALVEAGQHPNAEMMMAACGNALRNMVGRNGYVNAQSLLDPVPMTKHAETPAAIPHKAKYGKGYSPAVVALSPGGSLYDALAEPKRPGIPRSYADLELQERLGRHPRARGR